MAELISVEEARRRVLEAAAPLEAEPVALAEALGRVTAEDAIAAHDVQPFDNSAMDGFAVVAGDGPRLRLCGESRAGAPARGRLERGQAFRISTGAAVPEGAGAVVRVEDTEVEGDDVVLKAAPEPGANIRRAGEDFRAGAAILAAGSRIGGAELALLAAAGVAETRCRRRPRLHVVVTGDELAAPGEPLGPGQVHDSNGYAVAALAGEAGASVVAVERVGDEAAAVGEAVGRALAADVAVISGGVSVGEHDHVKEALARHGAEQLFWGVALRPGRPTWFGARGRTLAFGLPGNPVSAIVTFELFVRPALDRLLGRDPRRRESEAAIDEPYRKRPGRAHAVRCRLSLEPDGWHARPAPHQGSHVLTSMIGAEALAMLPAEAGDIAAGERVRIILRDEAWR